MIEIYYEVHGTDADANDLQYVLLYGTPFMTNDILTTYKIIYNRIKYDILNRTLEYINYHCTFDYIVICSDISSENLILNNPNKLKFDIDVTKRFRLRTLIENVI